MLRIRLTISEPCSLRQVRRRAKGRLPPPTIRLIGGQHVLGVCVDVDLGKLGAESNGGQQYQEDGGLW